MTDKELNYLRVAAYYIWENDGRPFGKEAEHWAQALAQLDAEKKTPKKAASAKKTATKTTEKKVTPAKKAVKKNATKATDKKVVPAKSKINPVPVKSATAKIITPLYGSTKK